MQEAGQVITQILVPALIAMILYVVVQLIVHGSQCLKARMEKQQAEALAAGDMSKAAMFNLAITVLNAVTNTVVTSMEAKKAYKLRQAVKAGEAKAEELKWCSTEAYEEIVELLSEEVQEYLDACVDDTETFIREKIEEMLPEIKAKYLQTLPKGDTAGNAEQVED